MIRLNRDDFEDLHQVAKLAATVRHLDRRVPPPVPVPGGKGASADQADPAWERAARDRGRSERGHRWADVRASGQAGSCSGGEEPAFLGLISPGCAQFTEIAGGNSTMKRHPAPGAESTWISPPWRSTSILTMARPRPKEDSPPDGRALSFWNLPNIFVRSSWVKPGPWSSTTTRCFPWCSSVTTRMGFPGGEYSRRWRRGCR